MRAVRLNPEMTALWGRRLPPAEGNTEGAREGHKPMTSASSTHRDQRTWHVCEGIPRNLRDLTVSTKWNCQRRVKSEASRDREKSECRIGAEKQGNRPEGPCGAKDGTGTWNR